MATIAARGIEIESLSTMLVGDIDQQGATGARRRAGWIAAPELRR
jgi:hypothetical protein